MLTSVLMNCHNGESFLREAIDSIYAQTTPSWEIIFIDNASTDRTAQIAQSYDSRLRYFRNPDLISLGKARNLALLHAKGDYIAFCDVDDIWLKDKLEKQMVLIKNNPHCEFIYGNYYKMLTAQNNKKVLGLKGQQPEGKVFEDFLFSYPVNLQTVVFKKELLVRHKLTFDEKLELSEDFDFFMRMLFYDVDATYINEPLIIYRIHAGMSSHHSFAKYPLETSYVLDKLRHLDPSAHKRHNEGLCFFEVKVAFWHLKAASTKVEMVLARKKLKKHAFRGFKFFLLFILSFFPIAFKKRILPV
jgi:glycosyltransferase involved in cell wall biosynthesis